MLSAKIEDKTTLKTLSELINETILTLITGNDNCDNNEKLEKQDINSLTTCQTSSSNTNNNNNNNNNNTNDTNVVSFKFYNNPKNNFINYNFKHKIKMTEQSNQKTVIELFDLPSTEKIYDDFGCAYSDTILCHGRMFVTQNYICFNSNILGFSQKFKLRIKDIMFIEKKKSLMKNTIEIVSSEKIVKNKTGRYCFTSFSSIEITYCRLKKVKKHLDIKMGRYNSKGISSSEESDLEESGNNESNNKASINTNNVNNANNANAIDNSNIYDVSYNPEMRNTINNVNNANNLTINKLLSNDDKLTKTDSCISNTSIINDKISTSFNITKKTNKNNGHTKSHSSHNTNDAYFKENSKHYLTVSTVDENFPKLDSNIIEIPKIVLDITVDDLFESCFKDNAPLSYPNFCKSLDGRNDFFEMNWEIVDSSKLEDIRKSIDEIKIDRGNTKNNKNNKENKTSNDSDSITLNNLMPNSNYNVNQTNITETNNNKEPVNIITNLSQIPISQALIREISFDMKVKNVPFINKSKIIKAQKLIRNNKSGFVFSSSSISTGVPYSDYFTVEEVWEAFPIKDINNNEKTILRIYAFIKFLKSTMLKSTIEDRSKQEYLKDIEQWKLYISNSSSFNGEVISIINYSTFKSKNTQKNSLNHGLVKDTYDPYEEEYKLNLERELNKNKSFYNKHVEIYVRVLKLVCYEALKEVLNKVKTISVFLKEHVVLLNLLICVLVIVLLFSNMKLNSKMDDLKDELITSRRVIKELLVNNNRRNSIFQEIHFDKNSIYKESSESEYVVSNSSKNNSDEDVLSGSVDYLRIDSNINNDFDVNLHTNNSSIGNCSEENICSCI